jgi:hypothetical protein
MKVEEIAEAVAKLPPDQYSPASAGGSPRSKGAAPITPRNSTPLRANKRNC